MIYVIAYLVIGAIYTGVVMYMVVHHPESRPDIATVMALAGNFWFIVIYALVVVFWVPILIHEVYLKITGKDK